MSESRVVFSEPKQPAPAAEPLSSEPWSINTGLSAAAPPDPPAAVPQVFSIVKVSATGAPYIAELGTFDEVVQFLALQENQDCHCYVFPSRRLPTTMPPNVHIMRPDGVYVPISPANHGPPDPLGRVMSDVRSPLDRPPA